MLRIQKLLFWLLSCLLLGLWPALVSAQGGGQNEPPSADQNPTPGFTHMINVTGCLKKDGGTGGFYVTDEGGRTWALTSKTIELAKHLNQVVSVAGPDRLRSNQSETNHQNQKQGTTVFADMQVKQLEVVSPSCTR